jgi:hypothetical protein
MYSAYAGGPTVKSEVKEETGTDSDVKPAPLHCVDAGMSLIFWWKETFDMQLQQASMALLCFVSML